MSANGLRPLPIDIVSVQSQVVYGHVGNSVALPCLRGHGLRALAVPTVLFSNTPHYPSIHGGAVPADWFQGYLQDLQARGALEQVRTILVGYLGSPEQMRILSDWIRQLLLERPEIHVIVDPVIGDHDVGIYVAPGMLQAYKDYLLPLAHGLTPNDFELGQFTSMPIQTLDDAIQAARRLLHGNLRWLVATSSAPDSCPADEIQIAVVTRDSEHIVRHPRIPIWPKGTGDMFCASLSAHLLLGHTLNQSVELACAELLQVIQKTHDQNSAELCTPWA